MSQEQPRKPSNVSQGLTDVEKQK